MISYVIRLKKLIDKETNNHRKLHGMPTKRWRQLFRIYDRKVQKADKERRLKYEKNISSSGYAE